MKSFPDSRLARQGGQNWLRVLFVGGTDEMPEPADAEPIADEFDQSPGVAAHDRLAKAPPLLAIEGS